jgi:hypothetical protein
VKCGAPDARGCIHWLGTRTAKGYGLLQVAGARSRKTTAHRVAWVISRGDLEVGANVLHRCDVPSCVNVDHLFLGSPKENTEDMVSKGRHFWRSRLPWQKLDKDAVERILELRRLGLTQQQVADQFGVSRPLISMIENGKIQHATQGSEVLSP